MECRRFLQCCCPNGQCPCFGKKEKYSHIEYSQPSRAIDVGQVQSKDVRIQKIFDFPQGASLLQQQNSLQYRTMETHLSSSVVMPLPQQPLTVREAEECNPMYVSDSGRTIGTISEQVSESPPFTPPHQHRYPVSHLSMVDEYTVQDKEEPAIEFSLFYDIQKRVLSVHLVHAYNLTIRKVWETADTFISVFLLPSRDKIYQTNILPRTRHTVAFDEVYEFQSLTSEELYEQVLVFQLFSRNKFSRDQLVGSVIVPFSEADLFGVRMVKKIGEGRELLQVQ